jgi:hypothetical protein
MSAQVPERSGSFHVIQVLSPNWGRLAKMFDDRGPVVLGRPVFPSYIFAEVVQPWQLSRPGVVRRLSGMVSAVELDEVATRASALATFKSPVVRSALGQVGQVVTLMGREFRLELRRGAVVATAIH